MTKRSAGSPNPNTGEVLVRLQTSMEQLQRDADALMQRTQQQAVALISRDQRKAVERLFRQAQRLRADLEKRAQRASRDVESRAERFLSTLEKETGKRLAPLLKRLDLPSRQEVATLSRRIALLEKRIKPSPKGEESARPAKRARMKTATASSPPASDRQED